MPSAPISCPRIRERLPQITATVDCSCRFKVSSGVYPTPVLHVLKPDQIKTFRKAEKKTKQANGAKPASSADVEAVETHREAEQKVRKITELKRHRRGIEASIARLGNELVALFDEAGTDTLELTMGTLRRYRENEEQPWQFRVEV